MPKRKRAKTKSFGIHKKAHHLWQATIMFNGAKIKHAELTWATPSPQNPCHPPKPWNKRSHKAQIAVSLFACLSPWGFSFSKMAQMALSASPTLTLFNSKLSSPMGWSIFIPHLHEKTVESARTLLLATFLVFSFCVCLVCKRNENPPELSQPEVFFYFEVIPMKSLIPRIGISFSLSIFSQKPNRTVLPKAIYIIIHALSWPIETFCGWMRKLWKQSKLLFLIVFFIMIFLLR